VFVVWAAIVMLFLCYFVLKFSKILAVLFCAAWRWPFWPVLPPGGSAQQCSLLQAGAWRQFWSGQAVAPVFASFFDFHVIVAWVVRHQCYNGFCI